MDWIKGIQRAIDYSESHLTEEIDYNAVAKEAAFAESYEELQNTQFLITI